MEKTVERYNSLALLQGLCLFLGVGAIVAFPFSLAWVGLERSVLWAEGVCCLLVMTLPTLFRREYDVFEPISFIMLSTVFGVTLRAIYMALYENATITQELLLYKHPGAMIGGGALILIALLFLTAGYMLNLPVVKVERYPLLGNRPWITWRLFLVIGFYTVVALVAMYFYFKTMGLKEFVLSTISTKHFYTISESQGYKKTVLGYYRWAASLIIPAFYLLLCWFAGTSRRWISPMGFLVVLTCMLAAVFPIMNSSRHDVVIIIVIAMVLWHYVRGEVKVRTILLTATMIILLLVVMLALRARASGWSEVAGYLTGETILDKTVGNRNYLGIDKAGQIVNAIPDKLPYEFGSTLVTWVVAPVPRTSWPDKPIILAGATIGQLVYETKDPSGSGAGVPPGFIPELYWNCGVPGTIVGVFLLGGWLKFLYRSFEPYIRTNKAALVIYVTTMTSFSFYLMGGTLSGAIIQTLTQTIPLFAAVWFIRAAPASRNQDREPVPAQG